ncbi:MAG: hypothetical protein HKN82_20270 [Akkermansiaceae bacterium]|nr:hypothetical protein [Akkermansiaceae bacterium]NNM28249.1 hypothetical protein [Akkermansiaceae bacterium]
MKVKHILLAALGSALGPATVHADSTIVTGREFAYGANIGWTNWKYDPAAPEGAVVGTYNLRGKVYGANVGWIDLGDGDPDDGIFYALTGGDWGVNHDGAGGLSGYAYGANIGWIFFDQSWVRPPRVDLATGAMSGFAYGANVGWISLDGMQTQLDCGPDTDGDDITDAWEYEFLAAAGMAADLGILGTATDADGDGESDYGEFLADTDPFDPLDRLQVRVTDVDFTAETVDLVWGISPRRTYDTYSSPDLTVGSWTLEASDLFIGAWTDSPGPLPAKRFYRVGPRIPLK